MSSILSTKPLRRALVAALMLVPLAASAGEVAGGRRVEVAEDQTTTVVGSFDSLAALLADLCTKARVEVRAYEAVDRRVNANYSERALAEVLERLLSAENYLLGVRAAGGEAGEVRVAWIRVTGGKQASSGALLGGITVPSGFGEVDIQRENPDDAMRAQQAVAARLLADEKRVAQFLSLDARELAASLRQYPHIDVLLRRLRSEQQHPLLIEKLDAVIEQLAESTGSGQSMP